MLLTFNVYMVTDDTFRNALLEGVHGADYNVYSLQFDVTEGFDHESFFGLGNGHPDQNVLNPAKAVEDYYYNCERSFSVHDAISLGEQHGPSAHIYLCEPTGWTLVTMTHPYYSKFASANRVEVVQ